jgi:nucleotide-binding universal stress UspA family protein
LALSIARRAGAGLQLVHVHHPTSAVYAEGASVLDAELAQQIKSEHQSYLDSVAGKLVRQSSVPIESMFLEGEVAATVKAAASKVGADLVVMTTHGRGPIGRFWLGSVADELARSLPMPLLLVRPHGPTPPLTPEPELKHVLLPLDGTALAEQMLEPAYNLGRLFGADYTLIRVIKPVTPVTYNLEGFTPTPMAMSVLDQIDKLHEGLVKEAQGYLDDVAKRLREWANGKRPEVRTRVVVEHQPGVAILHEAAEPIDLIAMETHGRRGFSRLFLGSVADKVIRGANLPVLVHKPVVA